MGTEICVYIGSCNGLLSDDTKPLLEGLIRSGGRYGNNILAACCFAECFADQGQRHTGRGPVVGGTSGSLLLGHSNLTLSSLA